MCAMYYLFHTLQGKTFHWNIVFAISRLASSLNLNSALLFDCYGSFNDNIIERSITIKQQFYYNNHDITMIINYNNHDIIRIIIMELKVVNPLIFGSIFQPF